MDTATAELVYRLPGNTRGNRPGAHRSASRGAGMHFISHAKLLDYPDPRRLDLRASIGNIRREWLVRVNQQRAAISVAVIVDVSASMHFGATHSKLHVTADFLAALGASAVRIGDSVGLQAFDQQLREDLAIPSRLGRGVGQIMSDAIRHCVPSKHSPGANVAALAQSIERVAGNAGLIFIISDFHWSLERLDTALDPLAGSMVVPLVIWDRAEVNPPEGKRLLSVRQMGASAKRHVWLTPRVRDQWRDNVVRRQQEISDAFASRDVKPFVMTNGFDAEALSRYFIETGL